MEYWSTDCHVPLGCFDGLARQTEAQQWNGSSAFSTVYYTYDLLDQAATKTTAAGSTCYYSCDWDGRLVNLTNPDRTHETRACDSLGNLHTRTTANGSAISYTYDALSRLVKVYSPSSGGTISYAYDASGNLISESGGWTYCYDYGTG